MGVEVPSFAVPYIKRASQGTGIGFATVACQVNEESGFNANAVSPTGAQGPYQFEPGTWRSYSNGNPFNWADSTEAYIKYMNDLLRMFNQSVFNALAAYNAGPGNIQAGFGYATVILQCAGLPVTIRRGSSGSGVVYNPGPAGQGSSDDWSKTIRNSGSQFFEAAANADRIGALLEKLW